MNQADWAIEVTNLTAGYGDTLIIENISFQVVRGDIFVIIGGSGCGKSTLLKHLIGLYPPLSGRIQILGQPLVSHQSDAFFHLSRQIGVAFQTGALLGSMTVLENVSLPLRIHTRLPQAMVDEIALIKLGQVGLETHALLMPSELSGGMIKRAAIARAMALDPAIIFLDEPSAGLDPVTSAELDQLILELSASFDITFVIVTHEMESVLTIADQIIMLDKQIRGILAAGTPEELKNHTDNPDVHGFFNRIPRERMTT